jgi:nucleotide-binding universal stress UspA family protein
MYGRVVVGVSESPANLAVVQLAGKAALQAGMPLVAVCAWIPPGGEVAARRSPCPALDDVSRTDARRTLAAAISQLPVELQATAEIARGRPGPVLVGATRFGDLLVVGTGRRRLCRPRGGPVARYCLAHAGCAVLAVPEPDLARDLKRLRRKRRLEVPRDLPSSTQVASDGY